MISIQSVSNGPTASREVQLRERAQQLESQFLSEMLRHSGSVKPAESFGGGIGEEQFSSFMREAHAAAISRRGGVGLAQHIFTALQGRENASK
ncbi:rod-binding protein [Falsigemmobacter faecalis]|uniref:Flagellar protein FlgJ N-terminal domain-containing protein n=1 Tax=Falsigemmobacter faecalis TaxID=2488730 RepID=A0A3P3D2K9_9RHOB|nr:rod-binding protein [Falsigemmobacter faecalis]RRH67612.1 hypothetical protein EG244_20020 [Falsigemmobacter faecalis]